MGAGLGFAAGSAGPAEGPGLWDGVVAERDWESPHPIPVSEACRRLRMRTRGCDRECSRTSGSLEGRATLLPPSLGQEWSTRALRLFALVVKSGRSMFLSTGRQDDSPVIETLKSHLSMVGWGGVQTGWRDCLGGRKNSIFGASQTGS